LSIHELFIDTFYFLFATLALIPIFRWLKLGSMLGYIVAGALIGPACLGLIDNSKSIFQLAELGIILLLFIVGLELSPARLKVLYKDMMIEGAPQMILTTLIFSCIGFYLGLMPIAALIVGVSLALSSTAFALSYLSNSGQMTLSHGQSSLSILLFQDLLIVPILAIIPIIGDSSNTPKIFNFSAIALKVAFFCSLITLCIFILKPAISFIRKTQDPEIILAAFLFLIIGMAICMEKLGLSMAMGSFLAGIFLANSEVKTNIKKLTIPFKGILMGLFFMTLGMKFEFNFLIEYIREVSLIITGIFVIKGVILFTIGKIRNGSYKSGFKLSLIISQGGEFGIVVLAAALQFNILNQEVSKLLVTSILITMAISPLLAKLSEFSYMPNKTLATTSQDVDLSNVVPIHNKEYSVSDSEAA
jgi:Kef-type K+ transport system membrane component KefB